MKLLRRYLRVNATQKGLFGGSQLWLAVWAFGTVRRLLRRFEGKEPTLDFSSPLAPGQTLVISHPAPAKGSRRSRRRGR